MYCALLAHISIPHVAALSIQIYTPATDGVVVFVLDPAHGMAPHDITLVVNVELVNVNEQAAFCMYILFSKKEMFVVS